MKESVCFIYNFSSLELSKPAQTLLNKGLKFCPTPKGINTTQLYADMFRMERKFAWRHFFKVNDFNPKNDEEFPFSTKKQKTNLPKEYPNEIKDFVTAVKSELLGSEFKQAHPNLKKEEREALSELISLQKAGEIVIQPADKGSGICLLDRKDYEAESYRQLNESLVDEMGEETSYYRKVDEKVVKEQYDTIKKVLDEGVENDFISKEFAKQLLPPKPKSGAFYLLPKVHKQYERIPKGRPIIPGCGSNTERISWLCDQMGKEFVKEQDSYIEDTPDLLRYFRELNETNAIPPNCKPIALDLKSMYTNIPIEEGIEAFRVELEKREDKSIPTDFLIKLLRLVLENNIFEFNREFWLQLLGTAMGTRVAPTYANIFMNKLEKAMLSSLPEHLKHLIFAWKRFIDDILLLFLGTCEELEEVFNILNDHHPTMKFDKPEFNEEENSTNFLDLKITIKEGKIETDLYRKETDKPTALLPSSAHPGHITPNIVYSMGFRLLRICSSQSSFDSRLKELKENFLLPRGYKPSLIDSSFKRIQELPGETFDEKRNEALKKKTKVDKNKDRIVVPIDFNPHMPKVSDVLTKHYRAMIRKNEELQEVFPSIPLAGLRQPKNLGRILCSSKLQPVKRSTRLKRQTHADAPGWKRCGTPCPICPFTSDDCSEVVGQTTGYVHNINSPVSCNTDNCIYYWKCTKNNCSDHPRCEYIGMTTRTFKKRLSEHRDYPKRNVTTEPSGEHFTKRGHTVADLKGLVLEKVKSKDPFVLKARESLLIKKFDTYNNGLNKEP